MRKRFISSLALFSILMGVCSCSNSDDAGMYSKGKAMISVGQSVSFTRAVDWTVVQNTALYDVVIRDASGISIVSNKLGELTNSSVELEQGKYSISVSHGEEKAASQNSLLLTGTADFSVEAGKETNVSVTCVPAVARVSVQFGDRMDENFSDYYVTYSTEALKAQGSSAVWAKSNIDPWYLIVGQGETVKATIHVVRASDGKTATIEREHVMAPGKAWTLDINAEEQPDPVGGTLIFSITIDDSTNDIPETIVVPDEWFCTPSGK